jgi:DNA gyrase subunit A
MEVGLVHKIDIDAEMQQAYLDYAMSVIVARALPDARDGLKPVHRRILYAMYDMGLRADSPYKKSARIVGEVLGKYHPHGDMAVYDAMARMAQDFSMRYLLIDGQGNFGSVDGDPPAAMRYTEARLEESALDLLADIHKDTVDFDSNFDGTLQEPSVLPAALPNLLVNGATGIAVGMATSIPPHNLSEVVEALKYMLENWEKLDDITVEDLMKFIQGPDFPTGGVILHSSGEENLASAYGAGRGRVTVRASAHLEEMERGRNRIIVTELPYMTNKSSLIERIAELAREERLQGIADLRDESDRQGMRIVIELNKAVDPEDVLRDLYKHTPMESTFSIIMLALVDGEPRMLSLKQALRVYLDHRLEIVRRRSEYDLDKARQRAHILEGLRVALQNLDEVIDLIRKAPDVETARVRLMKRFRLSEIQAQAILDMQLRRLAALERKKIEEEYKELQAQIKDLEGLLRSPKKMRQVVSAELQAVKEAYGDRRRTHIVHIGDGRTKVSLLTTTEHTPEKLVWLAVTPDGLISRSLDDKQPDLAGKDAPGWLIRTSTHNTLYLVSEQGEAAAVSIHAIPEAEKPSQGVPLWKASALREGSKLAALLSLPPKERSEQRFALSVTRQGMIKKSALSELPGPSAGTFTFVKVNEGDRLGWLRITDGQNEVLLVTAQGMAIRFTEGDVRPMGLVAAGVMGIKLQPGDEITGAEVLPQPGEVFLVASNGSAKRVPVEQFSRQGRYGQGIQAWKLPPKVQLVGMAVAKGSTHAILHFDRLAPQPIRLGEAPLQGRATRGKVIWNLKGSSLVASLFIPWMGEPGIAMPGEEKPAPSRSRKAEPEQLGLFQIPDGGTAEKKPVVKKPAGRATPAKPASGRRGSKITAVKPVAEKSTPKAGANGAAAKKSVGTKTTLEKKTSQTTKPPTAGKPGGVSTSKGKGASPQPAKTRVVKAQSSTGQAPKATETGKTASTPKASTTGKPGGASTSKGKAIPRQPAKATTEKAQTRTGQAPKAAATGKTTFNTKATEDSQDVKVATKKRASTEAQGKQSPTMKTTPAKAGTTKTKASPATQPVKKPVAKKTTSKVPAKAPTGQASTVEKAKVNQPAGKTAAKPAAKTKP